MADDENWQPEEDDVQLEAPLDGSPGEWQGPPAIMMSRAVQETLWNHAESDTMHEVGGILVGRAVSGPNGTLVEIVSAIPARHTEAGSTFVTFTHGSWTEWYEVIDRQFPGLQIVGWYHSHPDFGVFLSDHDQFIHRNFFAQPWQVAVVVDPVRRELGCFGWQEGQITRLPSDRLYQALERRPAEEAVQPLPEAIPMVVPTDAASGSKSLAERIWWLGWGVALALFVILIMQAYSLAQDSGLKAMQTELTNLQAQIASLQKTVQELGRRDEGRWYLAAGQISLADVCKDEYGREDLAPAIQAINGLRRDTLEADQRIWLPPISALMPGPPPSDEVPVVGAKPGEGETTPQPEATTGGETVEEVGPPSSSPGSRGESREGVFGP